MITQLLIACLLMAVSVTIHASGLAWALKRLRRSRVAALGSYRASLRMFILIAVWIVLLHLAEISVWAVSFTWDHALPNIETALYFSAVTYTTTGYGDVVLPQGWRLQGGVEALTGILMCGWSTGFFFAVVNRLSEARSGAAT